MLGSTGAPPLEAGPLPESFNMPENCCTLDESEHQGWLIGPSCIVTQPQLTQALPQLLRIRQSSRGEPQINPVLVIHVPATIITSLPNARIRRGPLNPTTWPAMRLATVQQAAIVTKPPATPGAAMSACVIEANAALALTVELPRAIKSAAPLQLDSQRKHCMMLPTARRLCRTGKRRLLSEM